MAKQKKPEIKKTVSTISKSVQQQTAEAILERIKAGEFVFHKITEARKKAENSNNVMIESEENKNGSVIRVGYHISLGKSTPRFFLDVVLASGKTSRFTGREARLAYAFVTKIPGRKNLVSKEDAEEILKSL